MDDSGNDGYHRLAGLSRRELLALASTVGAAAALGLPEHVAAAVPPAGAIADPAAESVRHFARTKPRGGDLGAVEHIVFLMMENRSYDHYFGAYPRGRGFDDHGPHSLGNFAQRYPGSHGAKLHPPNRLLPFHLDPHHGENCTNDLTHSWAPQHQCWHRGRNDRFVETHIKPANEGDPDGAMTMGYYTRRDIPYYWALADHFTLLDRYHCSVLGPTHPNRLMAMTGTIDPGGSRGGPVTSTNPDPSVEWTCSWPTMPEVLEDAHVSWKVYHPDDKAMVAKGFQTWNPMFYDPTTGSAQVFSDHVLQYFKAYRNPKSALHKKAFGPTFPHDFATDVKHDKLPHVSWIIPPLGFDDHPSSSPKKGQWFVQQVVKALTANRTVWAKSLLFVMYDENDGWFDHVPPPVAPPGTPHEELTAHHLDHGTYGIRRPIGMGFRVPALMISPFSRGGHVAGELFDHTSQLHLLRERFGVEVPNGSHWRRHKVGDLTSTLFRDAPNASMPHLPRVALGKVVASGACSEAETDFEQGGSAPTIPVHQRMPTQHGTTVPAGHYFPKEKVAVRTGERLPATSGRNTASVKSAVNPVAHGGRPVRPVS